MLSKVKNEWVEKDISSTLEVQVRYYHILANDIEEVIVVAKENPEFAYVNSASIEIIPVKKIDETGFVYPTQRAK